jgi:hypothetical protein
VYILASTHEALAANVGCLDLVVERSVQSIRYETGTSSTLVDARAAEPKIWRAGLPSWSLCGAADDVLC